MPSTYAHYRMGQEVIKQLSDPVREIIMENKELYDIGLHGPDILFYYHPLKVDPVNSIGYRLHEHSGKFFLREQQKLLRTVREKKKNLPIFLDLFAISHWIQHVMDILMRK